MTGHVVLLCGTSFSGKSTVARALADALPASVISLDAINAERGLHGGQGMPIEEWARTLTIAHDRVGAALDVDDTVIVDDTSSPRFLRDGWWELCTAHGAPMTLVFLDAPRAIVLARRTANRAEPVRPDVRDSVLFGHLDGFEPPGDDENPLRLTVGRVSSAQAVELVEQAIAATR